VRFSWQDQLERRQRSNNSRSHAAQHHLHNTLLSRMR
jgi:hypothetical protein